MDRAKGKGNSTQHVGSWCLWGLPLCAYTTKLECLLQKGTRNQGRTLDNQLWMCYISCSPTLMSPKHPSLLETDRCCFFFHPKSCKLAGHHQTCGRTVLHTAERVAIYEGGGWWEIKFTKEKNLSQTLIKTIYLILK